MLIQRLQCDPNLAQRPRLGNASGEDQPEADYNPCDEIRETLNQRAELYQQCAHSVVDARQSIEELVEAIAGLLADARDGQQEQP